VVTRARDLGLFARSGMTGPANAITDVAGVTVGHCTLIEGDGPLAVGVGPIRTGVTIVQPGPAPIAERPLAAGIHRLNGNGELTGSHWIEESGLLTSPIALTNTHSVGVVRDALVAREVAEREPGDWWSLPVVAETWDGILNDVNGQHVRSEHVDAALADASTHVEEGNVGGGTGMICHGFKGGIGTSSRQLAGGQVVGVLVQANHGARPRLTVDGLPVGRLLGADEVPLPRDESTGRGSIICIVVTDAPLLPHQCKALAARSSLGIGRSGGVGEPWSGDLAIAVSTTGGDVLGARSVPAAGAAAMSIVGPGVVADLYAAAVDATEEAIVNALVAADTMVGRDGVTAHRLPHDRLVELLAERTPR